MTEMSPAASAAASSRSSRGMTGGTPWGHVRSASEMTLAVAEPSAGPDVEWTMTVHASPSGSSSGGTHRSRPNA
jgi:hypothetical protein